MSEGVLYWVYDDTCTDPRTDGYVGITRNERRRFREHQKRFHENIQFKILHRGKREECFLLEAEYRPTPGIGWNNAPGGVQGFKIGHKTREPWNKGKTGLGGHKRPDVSARNKVMTTAGRSLSEEHRQAISISQVGKAHPHRGTSRKGCVHRKNRAA